MEGFDPGSDAWVAEGPKGLVGYAYAGDQHRTGELEADLWVHPDHHEPELGGRLLGLAERRGARLAVERGYRDASLDVFCITANRVKRELLRLTRLRAETDGVPHDRRPGRRRAGSCRRSRASRSGPSGSRPTRASCTRP